MLSLLSLLLSKRSLVVSVVAASAATLLLASCCNSDMEMRTTLSLLLWRKMVSRRMMISRDIERLDAEDKKTEHSDQDHEPFHL